MSLVTLRISPLTPILTSIAESVTTGGDGENSGLQSFPATTQKIGARSPPLASAPPPVPSDVGKGREGVPLSVLRRLSHGSKPITAVLSAAALVRPSQGC